MQFLIGNSVLAFGLCYYFEVAYPKAWVTGLVIGLSSIAIDRSLGYIKRIVKL